MRPTTGALPALFSLSHFPYGPWCGLALPHRSDSADSCLFVSWKKKNMRSELAAKSSTFKARCTLFFLLIFRAVIIRMKSAGQVWYRARLCVRCGAGTETPAPLSRSAALTFDADRYACSAHLCVYLLARARDSLVGRHLVFKRRIINGAVRRLDHQEPQQLDEGKREKSRVTVLLSNR